MRRDIRPWLPIILVATGLFFLLLSGSGLLSPLKNALGTIISPVEETLAAIFERLGIFTQSTLDMQALQRRVAELEQTNEALVQENYLLREYEAENEELRRQLEYSQDNPTIGFVGADVISQGCAVYPCADTVGQDMNPYLQYIVINTGARDGVAVGMPVVTGGSAMVGRIIGTSPNLSFLQLINDPDSQVAVMLQQSRVMGILEGSEEGVLYMTNILPDEIVNVGETVITSAIGGLLPRGLILGQIEDVTYQESELFQRATIRPAVDFRRLETVLVITDFTQPNLEELEVP